jgi:hypothetical protein
MPRPQTGPAPCAHPEKKSGPVAVRNDLAYVETGPADFAHHAKATTVAVEERRPATVERREQGGAVHEAEGEDHVRVRVLEHDRKEAAEPREVGFTARNRFHDPLPPTGTPVRAQNQ